jgi:hypothetical protein
VRYFERIAVNRGQGGLLQVSSYFPPESARRSHRYIQYTEDKRGCLLQLYLISRERYMQHDLHRKREVFSSLNLTPLQSLQGEIHAVHSL